MIEGNNNLMEQAPQGGVIPTAGKSAYQLWLDEGNIGTVIDFLRSLRVPDIDITDLSPEQIAQIKGVKGDRGERGLKGDKGDTGASGEKGDTGNQGDAGERGMPGLGGSGTINIMDNCNFDTTNGWSFIFSDPRGVISVTTNEATVMVPSGDFFGTPSMFLYAGLNYTISFEVKSSNVTTIDKVFLFSTTQKVMSTVNVTSSWSRVASFMLNVPTTGNYRVGLGRTGGDMNLNLRSFKMEVGVSTEPDWSPSINSMKGAKGDRGEKGDKGDAGIKGVTGTPGRTWLPNVDYDGVLTWIDSFTPTTPLPSDLKGAKGDRGLDGIAGTNGTNGVNGAKGDTGPMGEVIGVNMLTKSCFKDNSGWAFSPFGVSGSFTVSNFVASARMPHNSRFGFSERLFDTPGDYTYSFEAKTADGYQLNNIHLIGVDAKLLPNIILIYGSWKRFVINFSIAVPGNYTVTLGHFDNLVINVQFRRMKLEVGKKFTPEWTPSYAELSQGPANFDVI